MSNRLRKRYGCPVELAVDVLGGKWKTVILARIKESPLTFGELRRAIPDLADKVLSQKLRELTELGLLDQAIDASAPARKLYRLSSRGRELAPVLEALYSAGELLSGPLGIVFVEASRS